MVSHKIKYNISNLETLMDSGCKLEWIGPDQIINPSFGNDRDYNIQNHLLEAKKIKAFKKETSDMIISDYYFQFFAKKLSFWRKIINPMEVDFFQYLDDVLTISDQYQSTYILNILEGFLTEMCNPSQIEDALNKVFKYQTNANNYMNFSYSNLITSLSRFNTKGFSKYKVKLSEKNLNRLLKLN